jgi:hypothetical protein
MQDTVDKELNVGIRDTNGLQDTRKIVRNKPIAGPLREESESNDDPKTPQIAFTGEKGLPADVSSDGAIEFNSCFDFLKFVSDERILARASNQHIEH